LKNVTPLKVTAADIMLVINKIDYPLMSALKLQLYINGK
jgi:hypothetical protein